MTYSIDGVTYTNTSGVFNLVYPGTYSVTASSAAGCVSTATSVTIAAQPSAPAAPTASVTVQPTCDVPIGTIGITAPLGDFEYGLDGAAFQAATTFTLVAPGNHNVTVRSITDITCVSPATALTVNAVPIPAWAITKTASETDYDAVGDVITYNITLANTGNASISTVIMTDPGADAVPGIFRGTDQTGDNDNILETGEIWIYTAQHTITQSQSQ